MLNSLRCRKRKLWHFSRKKKFCEKTCNLIITWFIPLIPRQSGIFSPRLARITFWLPNLKQAPTKMLQNNRLLAHRLHDEIWGKYICHSVHARTTLLLLWEWEIKCLITRRARSSYINIELFVCRQSEDETYQVMNPSRIFHTLETNYNI